MSVENQIINKILNDRRMTLVVENNITAEYFPVYREQFTFLMNHYRKYGDIPDITTFLDHFPTFDLFDIQESNDYLINRLKEEHLFTKMVPVIQNCHNLMKNDSAVNALEYLTNSIPTLQYLRGCEAIDLTKDGADKRFETYIARRDLPNSVMSSGFTELDAIIGGWEKGEELVALLARLNQGKSWILEYFATWAWIQNYGVGYYSGEMSDTRVGYRFDTILKHFSNMGLVRGDATLLEEYQKHIESLKTIPHSFKIVTRTELGGRADIPKLENFIEKYELQVLFIDQYSLVDDYRASRNQDTKTTYAHISEDLFTMSCKYKIPIIGAVQANREGAKRGDNDGPPEVEHVADSDDIARNSSKVIALRQKDNTLEMQVRKNREAPLGDRLVYTWDIDVARFSYIRSDEGSSSFITSSSGNQVITNTAAGPTVFNTGIEVF